MCLTNDQGQHKKSLFCHSHLLLFLWLNFSPLCSHRITEPSAISISWWGWHSHSCDLTTIDFKIPLAGLENILHHNHRDENCLCCVYNHGQWAWAQIPISMTETQNGAWNYPNCHGHLVAQTSMNIVSMPHRKWRKLCSISCGAFWLN